MPGMHRPPRGTLQIAHHRSRPWWGHIGAARAHDSLTLQHRAISISATSTLKFALGVPSWLSPWTAATFLVSFAVLLAVSELLITRLRPTGDEPWYLLQSYAIMHLHGSNLAPLVRDHTIYAQFLGTSPNDHTMDYLGKGEAVLVNLPGYATLIGPLYHLGNRALVVAFQALVGALTGTLVFQEAHHVYASRKVAVLAWLAYLCALPVLLYARQIFPSTVASFAMFLGFVVVTRYLREAQGQALIALSILTGILAFALPWLHVKYALPALLLACVGINPLRPRLRWPVTSAADRRAWFAAATIMALTGISFMLIGIYSHRYFGTWTLPNGRVQADLLHPNFDNVAHLFGRMFLDPRSGLLPWVPLDMLVVPGLVAVIVRYPAYGLSILAFLVAQLATYLTAAVSPVFQGYALIGRFTVECAPFFALCVGGVVASVQQSSRSERAERVRRRIRGPVMVAYLILLDMTIGFALVGELAPHLLYPGASIPLVAKYASLLPSAWFALFPWF